MQTQDVRTGGMSWRLRFVLVTLILGLGGGRTGRGFAQEPETVVAPSPHVIHDGFEGPAKAWRREQSDAAIEIYAHERTRRVAREGVQAEGFEFKAGIGGGLYYSYALPPVPVTDDLKIALYVRANRVGMQFLARVVLPADVDPDSRQPSFVLIPGSTYETVDRWQKIELDDMMPAIERQARVLRVSSKRKVSLEGAYLERLVVNVYGGEGLTEVYLDDLLITPVPAAMADAHDRQLRGEPAGGVSPPLAQTLPDDDLRIRPDSIHRNIPGAAERIKFDRNRFTKDGFPWFPTMIRGFDADPTLIRLLGSDVAVVPVDANEEYLDVAIRSGLLLLPELNGTSDADPITGLFRPRPVDPDRLLVAASGFARKEHVFAWSLGNNLGEDLDLNGRRLQLRNVREAIVAFRKAKPGGSPYVTGTVLGSLPEYARIPENLDMIGIPAQTWATSRGPMEPLRYLEQRRLLTARGNADALIWSEVDVTAPPIYKRMIWGMDRPPEGGIPRVQPEQIRLATYTALAAGCRALSYRADGDLSQGPGRMNSIEVAFLNEEIDVLEPILADPDRSVTMLPVFMPEPVPAPPQTFLQQNTTTVNRTPTIKEQPPNGSIFAAAIPTKDRRGTLLLVSDYSPYSQYQPPQAAVNKLRLRVPAANDAVAYLISPGGVKPLNSIRVPGGHDITLDDYGLSAIVLMTTNAELIQQIELRINKIRPFAITWAIEQAQIQRAWVAEVDYQLRLNGHPQRDWAELLASADALIKSARDALEREDYPTAWDEARRVGRPLRILMREHFKATYDAIVEVLNDQNLPCGPTIFPGQKKPQPRLVGSVVAAPLASFNTLPQAWQWYDWIRSGRLGRNILPSGEFDFQSKDDLLDAGWTSVGYETDDIETKIALAKGGLSQLHQDNDDGSFLTLSPSPRQGLRLDAVVPFADHPIVAVQSPPVPVRAGEMYRISVLALMRNSTVPGSGGLIVRDSFGGERFQFRTPHGLPDQWFEIVYYRRIPSDGDLSVTLGLAAVSGMVAFDNLRIEPIVEQLNVDQIQQAAAVRPRPATVPVSGTATYKPDGTRAEPTPRRSPRALRPAHPARPFSPVSGAGPGQELAP